MTLVSVLAATQTVFTAASLPAEKLYHVLHIMLSYGAMLMIVTFYCLIAIAIKLRFKKIESVIENQNRSFETHLATLSSLCIQLCDVCKHVNRILTQSIGFYFLFNVVSSTFIYFEIYLLVFDERTSIRTQYCILMNVWNSFLTFYMIMCIR